MIISVGKEWIHTGDIIGIFDLDITSQSHITRAFLKASEQGGLVINATEDIPKSFTVCYDGVKNTVVLSQFATGVLRNRAEKNSFR